MKKIIAILVIMITMSAFVNAQKDYKPASGNVAVEVNFTPLSATPIGLNYLKARYFIEDDFVLRLGLDIRMNTNKSEPTKNKAVKTRTNLFSITSFPPRIEV